MSKSGTNNWHGTGWGYNRNRNYDAFDNQQKARGVKDRSDYNRDGASAGGPILRNRWFIFGAYEFQNQGLAASSPQVKLPTAAGLNTAMSLAQDDAVRLAEDPERSLLSFLESAYAAAATLGHWDRSVLECNIGQPGRPRAP